MNKTVYEQGEEKGMEKERRNLVKELLEERFGPLSEEIHQQLEEMSMEELRLLAMKIVKANSLEELGLPQ